MEEVFSNYIRLHDSIKTNLPEQTDQHSYELVVSMLILDNILIKKLLNSNYTIDEDKINDMINDIKSKLPENIKSKIGGNFLDYVKTNAKEKLSSITVDDLHNAIDTGHKIVSSIKSLIGKNTKGTIIGSNDENIESNENIHIIGSDESDENIESNENDENENIHIIGSDESDESNENDDNKNIHIIGSDESDESNENIINNIIVGRYDENIDKSQYSSNPNIKRLYEVKREAMSKFDIIESKYSKDIPECRLMMKEINDMLKIDIKQDEINTINFNRVNKNRKAMYAKKCLNKIRTKLDYIKSLSDEEALELLQFNSLL